MNSLVQMILFGLCPITIILFTPLFIGSIIFLVYYIKDGKKNSWTRKNIVGLIISIVAAIITLAVLTVCLSYFIYTLYHPPALQKYFNQSSSSSASSVAQQIYLIKIWLLSRF